MSGASREMLGKLVRDRRSGLSGRVIGFVTWEVQPETLVVQPPVRPDSTVPPTAYVQSGYAEIVPEPTPEPKGVN